MLRTLATIAVFGVLCCFKTAFADGPADNSADDVRSVPPPGMNVPAGELERLGRRCELIRQSWSELELADERASLASEVLVFPRSVELAIEFGQFYKPKDLKAADAILDQAESRIKRVADGAEWAEVVGLGDGSEQQLIVGGFRSDIDDSYQPYGLVIPAGLSAGDARPRRLDIWFHGRGETQSEVAFLTKQQNNAGEYQPNDTIVLHPYGRYCNAFKFAGEVDVLEALAYVQSKLPVDEDRISVRGFSMGGAACWQFATRYADRWSAANPGAGFSETPLFLDSFQGEDVLSTAPDYQQKLWQICDNPNWVSNLRHCPTIAYSGENDRQKQAADVMADAFENAGMEMVHIIGADMGHKIDRPSKQIIEETMSRLTKRGRVVVPRAVSLTTFTLKYGCMHWVDVQGLGEHWSKATVDAKVVGDDVIEVDTENVERLRLNFEAGQWPGTTAGSVTVRIDGEDLQGPMVRSDRSWSIELQKFASLWMESTEDLSLRKRPGLQGPIDDALMSRFLFVLPSGKSNDDAVQTWVERESQHAMTEWRRHFRGDVPSVQDTDVTDEQIANCNLLLFGDAQSNSVIAKIADALPIQWNEDKIAIGNSEVPSNGHVPILIQPNPLNLNRYVVLNSGFTYREYDYLNNARQTPKLPDWALVDIREGATMRDPGKVTHAGFFGEDWQP